MEVDLPEQLFERYFQVTEAVQMNPDAFLEWLSESGTNSPVGLKEAHVSLEIRDPPFKFPLAGRKESVERLASSFRTVFENRSNGHDRTSRHLPFITGVPGLGKSRLLLESPTRVLDESGLKGKRVSAYISFGNDKNSLEDIDKHLGIECAFAWRVLHLIFKGKHTLFGQWMRDKSPSNRKLLTLSMVLEIIELHFASGDHILLFIAIDEYQSLGQANLDLLIKLISKVSHRSPDSQLTLFCVFGGTDLEMKTISRSSFPQIQSVPIRFLSHSEAVEAIGPYISKVHPLFVQSNQFFQNVFYLGGIPRLLTLFAEEVCKLQRDEMNDIMLLEVRKTVLENLRFPELTRQDLVRMLAYSFSNLKIKIRDMPFTSSESAKNLTWSKMVALGMCLIEHEKVIVPYHLVLQTIDIEGTTGFEELNKYEKELILSIQALNKHVEIPMYKVPPTPHWFSWESFGARFYAIRINSFLVLGYESIRLGDLVEGCCMSASLFFDKRILLKPARVVKSELPLNPKIPREIRLSNTSYEIDWIENEHQIIVLNSDGGAGVDLFFLLEREDKSGYFLFLDQRKRYANDITPSHLKDAIKKIPNKPRCLYGKNVENVFGFMNLYSKARNIDLPESTFMLTCRDSSGFHGTLFDHPGCALNININTATVSALGQLYRGPTFAAVTKYAKLTACKRNFRSKEEFIKFAADNDMELDAQALYRISF